MQTPEALVRVARECAEDLADDGIVYAEVRFAPELHLERDMALDDVVEAVQEGFRVGSEGRPIRVRTLLTAMRTAAREPGDRRPRRAVARSRRVWVRHRRRGGGLPPHAAPRRVRTHPRRELPPDDPCGRGVRAPLDLGSPAALRCRAPWPRGPHRRRHRGRRPTGRPAWGGSPPWCATVAFPWSCVRHPTCIPARRRRSRSIPIGLLADLRFRVTVNTDNRLMSAITLSREMANIAEAFGWGWIAWSG